MEINGPKKTAYIDGKGGREILMTSTKEVEEFVAGGPPRTTTAELLRPGEVRCVATGRVHPICGGEIFRVERAEGKADFPDVYGDPLNGIPMPVLNDPYATGSWPKATGNWNFVEFVCRKCRSRITDIWPLDDLDPVSPPSPSEG
jgi:hypothetical protein